MGKGKNYEKNYVKKNKETLEVCPIGDTSSPR